MDVTTAHGGRAAAAPVAIKDLAEWTDDMHPTEAAALQLSTLLGHELSVDKLVAASPSTPALTDDRPINEYYAWRRLAQKLVLAAKGTSRSSAPAKTASSAGVVTAN